MTPFSELKGTTDLLGPMVDAHWPEPSLAEAVMRPDPVRYGESDIPWQLEQRYNPSTVVADYLQTYVLRELPAQLAHVAAGKAGPEIIFESVQQLLLSGQTLMSPEELPSTAVECRRTLALLDLTMAKRALQLCGQELPQVLVQSLDVFAKFLDLPPDLTYGLLVRDNPAHRLRTFTEGAAAYNERLFYGTHQLVETELEAACEALKLLSGTKGTTLDLLCLNEASRRMQNVIDILDRNFAEFTGEKFGMFRDYLRKLDGAPGLSGVYSANQHAIRFFTFGDAMKNRFGLVEKQHDYFPRQDRERLDWGLAHAQNGTGLKTCVEGNSEKAIRHAAATFASLVYQEMERHIIIANRAIPQVFLQRTQGTGGLNDAGNFLVMGVMAARAGLEPFMPFMSSEARNRVTSDLLPV